MLEVKIILCFQTILTMVLVSEKSLYYKRAKVIANFTIQCCENNALHTKEIIAANIMSKKYLNHVYLPKVCQ